MDFYLQYGNYLSNILQSLIKNKKPAQPDFQIDWSKFFHFCMHHKVANMVYLSIKDFNVPKEVLSKFRDVYSKLTFIEAKQEIYSTMVYSAFEDNEVSFLPVKGILIKKLYPVENYRSSGDIDILIKDSDFEKSCKVLESLGYKTFEKPNKGNDYHISYEKNSVHIELHSSLAPKDSNFYDYFNKSFHRAYLMENSKFHYLLNNEDFYIYTLYHLYKHFVKGGVGVRYFLDMYLINEKMTFNNDYLNNELKKLGLFDFNETVKQLSQVFFENKSQDKRLTELSRFVYISGAHGEQTFFAMSIISPKDTKKKGFYLTNKIKYFCDAWFIGYDAMKERYKVLVNHKWLLPFCYIHKGFYTLIKKPKAIVREKNNIANMNKDVKNYIDSINKMAGI